MIPRHGAFLATTLTSAAPALRGAVAGPKWIRLVFRNYLIPRDRKGSQGITGCEGGKDVAVIGPPVCLP